ncbi:hypothetical protein KC19_VG218400 [Ceratodon purpureus]|uniref:Secreted protein n=1 Tax=Ceratodon purpureus TaxID=3225 RepID=A0A8T0HT31_CERPU|nr:hypothetical protein KC19_VG218400 [Ceratodon purpureus]
MTHSDNALVLLVCAIPSRVLCEGLTLGSRSCRLRCARRGLRVFREISSADCVVKLLVFYFHFMYWIG